MKAYGLRFAIARTSLSAICITSLISCSMPIELRPTAPVPPAPLVVKNVGVYYAPELRARQDKADYGETVFSTGSGTVALFDQLFPKVFASVTPVAALGPSISTEVIEPRIVAFSAAAGPGPQLPGHAVAIAYSFVLRTPHGDVAQWRVVGEATGSDSWSNLADQAMEDAARRFVRSFADTPEPKRWASSLPLNAASASKAALVVTPAPEFSPGAMRAAYPGVVDVVCDGLPDLTDARGFLSLHVVVHNTGSRRLLLRRDDIDLSFPDGKTLVAMPPEVYAAEISPRYARVGAVAGGTGLAALPALFGALANAGVASQEENEFEANQARWRGKALARDISLAPGASADGYILFVGASNTSAPASRLMLGIDATDADAAVRYPIRIPLSAPSAAFRPFKGAGEPRK